MSKAKQKNSRKVSSGSYEFAVLCAVGLAAFCGVEAGVLALHSTAENWSRLHPLIDVFVGMFNLLAVGVLTLLYAHQLSSITTRGLGQTGTRLDQLQRFMQL